MEHVKSSVHGVLAEKLRLKTQELMEAALLYLPDDLDAFRFPYTLAVLPTQRYRELPAQVLPPQCSLPTPERATPCQVQKFVYQVFSFFFICLGSVHLLDCRWTERPDIITCIPGSSLSIEPPQ